MVKNVFHISDDVPSIYGYLPQNRIISSSFKYYENEKESFGFSLKMPLVGMEKYIVDNKAYPVSSGAYFLAHHGQLIGYELKDKMPILGLCIYLDEALVRSSIAASVTDEQNLLDNPGAVPFQDLISGRFFFEQDEFFRIVKQFVSKRHEEMAQEELDQWFYGLAGAIGRQMLLHQKRKLNLGIKKKSTQKEIYARLAVAQQFLHDCMDAPMNIKEMAACANLSEFHFIRSFKLCFGISPYQYLTKIRVEKAKELLDNHKFTMGDIAAMCGFNDESMFSKIFKKHAGIPPSRYRMQLQQG